MRIYFTVKGTHEGPLKNPIGYYRMTQRSKFADPGAKRYMRWKSHVRVSLVDDDFWRGNPDSLTTQQLMAVSANEPPLEAKEKVTMDITIFFKDKRRSDPDNVFKGIADALFRQDKNVVGSFDFDYDKENPRVEVQIYGLA